MPIPLTQSVAAAIPNNSPVDKLDLRALFNDLLSGVNSIEASGAIFLTNIAGSANAITADMPTGRGRTAIAVGMPVALRTIEPNTGPVTLTVGGLTLPVLDGAGRALIGGEFAANMPLLLRLSGNAPGTEWRVMSALVQPADLAAETQRIENAAQEALSQEASLRAGQDGLLGTTLAPVQDRTANLIDLPPIAMGARQMQPETVSFDLAVERGYWLDNGLPWLPGGQMDDLFRVTELDGITVTEWSFDLRPLRGYVTATGEAWPPQGGSTAPVTLDADLLVGFGQSNEDYQSGGATSLVFGADEDPNILTLARGDARDIWLGQTLGGGQSEQLVAGTITGISPYVPQTAANGPRGTGSVEAMARKWTKRKGRRAIIFTLAEGGQGIGNLLDSAASQFWAARNVATALQRARDLWPSDRNLVWRWMPFQQGESNRSQANLAELHEQVRSECEAKAQAILGQTEALRMLTWQPSSHPAGYTSIAGILSLMDYAVAHDQDASIRTKTFFCGGPTYPYPWSSDYLHQSSIGHAMRGDFADAVARRVEDEGFFLPLCPLSAAVTGANQITVTMSEAVEQATDTHVAAVENLGVTLTGATISGVNISGREVTITTANAASAATQVGFGVQGQTEPRSAAGIPRTNIRAVRPMGAYSPALAAQAAGGLIRNWCAHRAIPVIA